MRCEMYTARCPTQFTQKLPLSLEFFSAAGRDQAGAGPGLRAVDEPNNRQLCVCVFVCVFVVLPLKFLYKSFFL